MKLDWVKFPLLLMIVLVLINGCGQSDNQSPDSVDTEQIGIRGMVKELTKGDQQISILVEGELEEDTQYDLAVVTVNKQTEVVREGTHIAILLDPLDEIREGDFIEVIFTGGVAESYPVQAVAAKVTILSYVDGQPSIVFTSRPTTICCGFCRRYYSLSNSIVAMASWT